MYLYKTAAEQGSAEEVISRSKFIAYVKPIETYQDGQDFVAEIREKHKDATHNVPTIVCGNKQELQWTSDDGEPQGTAGSPILKLIVDLGLTNIAVVVTRYFGGTKLGTGGLVRAYQGVAKKALEEIGIAGVSQGVSMTYIIDYSDHSKIKNIAQTGAFKIDGEAFTDKVEITVSGLSENAENIKQLFSDLTGGKGVLSTEKNIFLRSIIDMK